MARDLHSGGLVKQPVRPRASGTLTATPPEVTMRPTLALLLVGLTSLLSVASAPDAPSWEEQTDYPLQMGVGWEDFETYDEIGGLAMEMGFQGGQHLNASLRATGVETMEGHRCTVTLVDPEAAEDQDPEAGPLDESCDYATPEDAYYADPGEFPDDLRVIPSLRLIVDDPDAVLGRELELRVQVVGPDGTVGRAWHQGEVTWLETDDDEP